MYQKQTLFDGRPRALADLMSHEIDIRGDKVRMSFYADMEAIMMSDQLVVSDEDRQLLFKLFCQVLINSFGILGERDSLSKLQLIPEATDADPERKNRLQRVGAVLYVEGSAYDHR